MVIFHHSMDWFKGKSTGNHGFYHFLPTQLARKMWNYDG
jgi:hypothetical protein